MSESVRYFAEMMAALVETIGIGILAFISVFVVVFFVYKVARQMPVKEVYGQTRRMLGHGILLGLEFLVAADIIHTVAVELTLNTVTTLAIIVAIRTFLSFTLEIELTGSWPWKADKSKPAGQ